MGDSVRYRICEISDAPVRLGAAVLWQAARDIKSSSEAHRLSAEYWLRGGDALISAETVARALGAESAEFERFLL